MKQRRSPRVSLFQLLFLTRREPTPERVQVIWDRLRIARLAPEDVRTSRDELIHLKNQAYLLKSRALLNRLTLCGPTVHEVNRLRVWLEEAGVQLTDERTPDAPIDLTESELSEMLRAAYQREALDYLDEARRRPTIPLVELVRDRFDRAGVDVTAVPTMFFLELNELALRATLHDPTL
ncbi:hypothetical protein KBC54_03440 [Patescibacteria group bacterium]|nr:hypothetical protein [Patescibacteria group bacterium]